MTKSEVFALLKEHADDRGIAHWDRQDSSLKSFGIGLTKLRGLAKQIGRDHRLASVLWKSDCYDAKVIGLLIENPKKMTREQAEAKVDGGLDNGHLVHVFTTRDATLAKTPFAFELSCDWMASNDAMRRRCGYGLLYELSKKKSHPELSDEFLLDRIVQIRDTIHEEDNWVRDTMSLALMGIGKRNAPLNRAAITAAREIGPVDIDYGAANGCEPLDVLKHLDNDRLRDKFSR